jgi:hypothetical protein
MLTVKNLLKRQEEILNSFPREQQNLITEALNIEYKLALVEEGYALGDID